MKNLICILLLFIVYGYGQDNSYAQSIPENQEKEAHRGKNVADENFPVHHFELVAAENPATDVMQYQP